MAQIISGVTPQEVNFAYLAGHERGVGLVQERERLNLQRQQMQFEQESEIRRAMAEHQKEQARSQALLNQQAQMGDAQAVQELAMRMQAGQDPDQQMMQEVFGIGSRITDPDARALYAHSVGKILDEREKSKQDKVATDAIERMAYDKKITPEQKKSLEERKNAGESPQKITKELGDLETETTAKNMAKQNATAALEKAQAIFQTLKPGTEEYFKIQALINQYAGSPTDQEKPGSDADFFYKVQNAVIESAAEKKRRMEEMQALHEKRAGSIPQGTAQGIEAALPQGGFSGALGIGAAPQPYEQPPGLKRDVERAKTEKEKRSKALPARTEPILRKDGSPVPKVIRKPDDVAAVAVSLAGEAKDGADLIRLLKERGVRVTEENKKVIRKALEEERNRAQSTAGATRR